jgi:hypothetical protein
LYRCEATFTRRSRGLTRTLITLLVMALDFVVYAVVIIGLTVAVYAPPAVVWTVAVLVEEGAPHSCESTSTFSPVWWVEIFPDRTVWLPYVSRSGFAKTLTASAAAATVTVPRYALPFVVGSE